MESLNLRELSAAASEDLGLEWATIVGVTKGQCGCRLGIWSGPGDAPVFTPMAWKFTPDELLGAMYGRFLLETAMELEGDVKDSTLEST